MLPQAGDTTETETEVSRRQLRQEIWAVRHLADQLLNRTKTLERESRAIRKEIKQVRIAMAWMDKLALAIKSELPD